MFRKILWIAREFFRVLFHCRFTRLLDIISFFAVTLRKLANLRPDGPPLYPAVMHDCVLQSSGKWYYCRGMSDDFYHIQGYYELRVRSALLQALNLGDVFVDVGANVGSFVFDAARKVGGEGLVVAVEPAPATVKVLKRNLRMNGINNVLVLERAAYSKSAVLTLYYSELRTGGASLKEAEGWTDRFEVSAEPLDGMLECIGDRTIGVVKIDVEGAEKDVLRGARETLSRARRVIIEVHDSADTRDLIQMARSAGHKCAELKTANQHYIICEKSSSKTYTSLPLGDAF